MSVILHVYISGNVCVCGAVMFAPESYNISLCVYLFVGCAVVSRKRAILMTCIAPVFNLVLCVLVCFCALRACTYDQ